MFGSFVIPAGGCTIEEKRPKNATNVRSMHVPDAENAVCYLEIVTTDVQATADFYASAYGWHRLENVYSLIESSFDAERRRSADAS